MKRGVFILCIILAVLYFAKKHSTKTQHSPQRSDPEQSVTSEKSIRLENTPSPAEDILSGYGSPSSKPIEDLQKLSHLLQNILLTNKSSDTRHFATNEDFAEFILGKNPNQISYLSAQHPIFNTKKQVIDRWQSPIIIHIRSRSEREIRSAGQDMIPYTEDDLLWPPQSNNTLQKDF